MRLTTPLLLSSLLAVASADFFVSNTSVCMGTFIVQNCYHGVKVLSGVDPKKDYTCGNLQHAEDNNYLRNGTAGPFGAPFPVSENGICNSGKLNFEKNEEGYTVHDKDGQDLGSCVWDNSTTQHCNQWVGMLFFQSMYKCTSTVCS